MSSINVKIPWVGSVRMLSLGDHAWIIGRMAQVPASSGEQSRGHGYWFGWVPLRFPSLVVLFVRLTTSRA
jgi:hypothetical protein